MFLLKIMARYRMKKFRGKIVIVTGSVGKTSTKDAIFTVLNRQFRVRRSEKSMNSEFGLLLTILDIESGYSSAFKWGAFLLKAFYNSFSRDHSEILLLELGVDKKGDMDFLLSIVRPDVTVFTNVSPVHIADGQFAGLDEIFEEKRKAIDAMGVDGIAVLNVDNEFIAKLAKKRGKKNTLTYSIRENADFRARSLKLELDGTSFILEHEGKKYEVSSSVLGKYNAFVMLPAIICGLIFKMDIVDAILALGEYQLPPGRMSLIAGKDGSSILDSSYNSSPEALLEALKLLGALGEGKRKIAVLGSMNELGTSSHRMHEELGRAVPKYADELITVGKDAEFFAKGALNAGMEKGKVSSYANAHAAAVDYVPKSKDLLLVKGSQNMVRLERFVKAVMAEPERASELLVRQEKDWKKID